VTSQPVYPAALIRSPEPPDGVRLTESVRATMRDGIRLAVDIYAPLAEGRFPVLLSLSPYSKDIQQKPPHWSHAIESGATGFYVAHGYIHVVAQGRGAGLSEGRWALFDERERTDGYDLVEWIAAQPWCDGNVGMIGDSYWSWSQYHAAAQQPPHLRCICQCDGTTDLYRDMCYQGGVYNAEFLDTWISYQTKMAAWPGPIEGKEPPMHLAYETAMRPTDGSWYQERSAWSVLDRIKVPVMSISPQGGAMHMRGQLAGYPRIQAPKKLLVVPPTGFWSHLRYLTNPALNAQMLRWFDHWLKGIDSGLMDEPEVAIFDTGTSIWRHEAGYPLARTNWQEFFLAGDGTVGGSLGAATSAAAPPDVYGLPASLARTLAGKPVLSYTTAPLDAPLRLWGPLSLTLHAASTQPDTVWHVKLGDMAPDGAVRPLSRGILRASFRAVDAARSLPGQPFHPFDQQILLEPGATEEYQIELRPVFHTLAAGHRLVLTIASEDVAYSNRQRTIDVQLLPWPVENSIFHDSARPSHLLLPVVPDAPEICPVGAPIANIQWPLVAASWMADTDDWPLQDHSV
jgi:predicted acyl esterase